MLHLRLASIVLAAGAALGACSDRMGARADGELAWVAPTTYLRVDGASITRARVELSADAAFSDVAVGADDRVVVVGGAPRPRAAVTWSRWSRPRRCARPPARR